MKILNRVSICLMLASLFIFANEKIIDELVKIEKACTKGNMQKCYDLGVIYNTDIFVIKDIAKAKLLFKMACTGNIYSACAQLGRLEYKPFLSEGEELLAKACDNNDFAGCARLGLLYPSYPDKEKSEVYYYKKACDAGDWVSCNEVGKYFYSIKDEKSAKKYFKKACNSGKGNTRVKFDPALREKWQGACNFYKQIK